MKRITIITSLVLLVLCLVVFLTKETVLQQDYKKVVQSGYQYFGNEVFLDLDNDQVDDVAFIVTREDQDKNLFYLVGAIRKDGGYLGTKTSLLGENISPQTTEKRDGGVVLVNFAVGENPSVGKSTWFKLDPIKLQFIEVKSS